MALDITATVPTLFLAHPLLDITLNFNEMIYEIYHILNCGCEIK